MLQKKRGISQCMIVKNEEENIRRALSWGREFLLEQIVVDTGSTDRTKEIAREMGAKVYSFSWTDDFAAAKNFAIEKAQGEWIAFLDADEIPAPGDEQKMKVLADKLDSRVDAVACSLLDLDEEGKVCSAGTQIRMFRNLPDLRYHRRIHEQLLFEDGRPFCLADAVGKISILHTGYAGKAAERKKTEGRNLRLLMRELEENPESSEILGYIGDEYGSLKETGQARKWYESAIAAMGKDEKNVRCAATFSRLMQLEAGEKEEEKVRKLYTLAVSRIPEEPDFDYILGRYLASEGNYDEGSEYIGRAFEKLEKFGNRDRAMILGGDLPKALEAMTVCSQKAGKVDECIQYGRCLLQENPYEMGTLVAVLKAFLMSEKEAAVSAENFLHRIYGDRKPLKATLFCLRAAKEIGWEELENKIYGWLTKEEAFCLKAALGKENGKWE